MARKKKDPTAAPADVDAIRHKEKRKDIPTDGRVFRHPLSWSGTVGV